MIVKKTERTILPTSSTTRWVKSDVRAVLMFPPIAATWVALRLPGLNSCKLGNISAIPGLRVKIALEQCFKSCTT